MSGRTEDELRGVIAEYEATKNAAIAKRDAELRAFHADGWRAVDLQRVTGYSRETIRQVLHPHRQGSKGFAARASVKPFRHLLLH